MASNVPPVPPAQDNRRNARLLEPSSICEACRVGPFSAHLGLFHAPISSKWSGEGLSYDGGYSYSASEPAIKDSAAAGCAWCKLLLALLTENVQRRVAWRSDGPVWKISVGLTEDVHGTPANVQALQVVINCSASLCTMLLHTSADDLAAPFIIARPPILDVGSAHALSLAKSYIGDCLHRHERCIHVSPSSDVRLPTRLIDCTDPNRMRLVSTEGGYGRYLALSYVWGEPQPHQTTSSNVSVYMDGIDASHLPQTLRDAIRVTHALGFQYLWVDSLCIIQDEDKDRVHEIRWMHLVYRYAHLTIIAASAGKVSDGFLQDRLAEDVVQITLPFLCPPRPSPSLSSLCSLYPWSSSFADIDTTLPSPSPRASLPPVVRQVGKVHASFSHLIQQPSECSYDSDPIHERGWCLQEFYLSPRTLIFSGRTLQFRCQNDTRNIGDSFYNTIADVQLPDILLHPTPPHAEYGSSEWSEVHGGWSQIVAMYTKRAISQPSDKLVACGALAEACHRVLRVDYLAGLWRDTLLHDLLWYVAARLQSRVVSWRRPAEYRAPSWSWASTADGSHRHVGMQWHATAYADKTAVAEVIRCEVTLKDQDLPFGEVTAGCLVLRATLISCRLHLPSSRHGILANNHILLPHPRRERCPSVHGGSAGEDDAMREPDTKVPGWYILDAQTSEGESKWIVPLLQRESPHSQVYGLIVGQINLYSDSHRERGMVYRRLGTFSAESSWDALQAYGSLEDIELI